MSPDTVIALVIAAFSVGFSAGCWVHIAGRCDSGATDLPHSTGRDGASVGATDRTSFT